MVECPRDADGTAPTTRGLVPLSLEVVSIIRARPRGDLPDRHPAPDPHGRPGHRRRRSSLGILLLPAGSAGALTRSRRDRRTASPVTCSSSWPASRSSSRIAKNNGTVDWLVHAAVRSVGGRVALIPWVFFAVTGVLTAHRRRRARRRRDHRADRHDASPASYDINQVLMGLMVINGATAGGFSPLSIFGSITNDVVSQQRPGRQPAVPLPRLARLQRRSSAVVTFVLFGGRQLVGVRDVGDGELVAADGSKVRAGSATRGPARAGPASGRAVGVQRRPAARASDDESTEPVTTLDLAPEHDARRHGRSSRSGAFFLAARRGLLRLPHRVAALPR